MVVRPLLDQWLADSSLALRKKVLVVYRERVGIPHFPGLDETKPRTHPVNLARLKRARALVTDLQRNRARRYAREEAALATVPGARIVEKFWLAPVYAIELPLGSLVALTAVAGKQGAVVLEPAVGLDPPPTCPDPSLPSDNNGSPGNEVDDPAEARRVMRTDEYRSLGLLRGSLSLLDTGVWRSHRLLAAASFGVMGDCIHGNEDCLDVPHRQGFDPSDQCRDHSGHGTAAAAILAGTGALGERWRGGLDLSLDSYQVFAPGDCGGECGLCLDRIAAGRAFQTAVSNLHRVIVANIIAASPDDIGSLCRLADNAFRAGAVVVAANGNRGPREGTVASPAAAPCALGVGARNLRALQTTDGSQARGPAEGDRIKPDIQAPTGSETAQFDFACPENTNLLATMNGTSGATPYAGVAAALLRDWMKAADPDIEPGHVYAAMILSGRTFGAGITNATGAGLIELPSDCCFWFGAEEVRVDAPEVELPLEIASDAARLEAAIWWPQVQTIHEADDEPLRHNNLDLVIANPDGQPAASSEMVRSVFERATATTGGRAGTWKLRITARSFHSAGREEDDPPSPNARQIVYWAAAARRNPNP